MSYDVWMTVTETHTLVTRVEAKSKEEAETKVDEAMNRNDQSAFDVCELEIEGKTVTVEHEDFAVDDFQIVEVREAVEVAA